jgi:hypothetical protein
VGWGLVRQGRVLVRLLWDPPCQTSKVEGGKEGAAMLYEELCEGLWIIRGGRENEREVCSEAL